MQTARDTYNQLEYAKKNGREEGQNEERILIATKMLQMKLPVQSISEATGLTEEEVAGLKEN